MGEAEEFRYVNAHPSLGIAGALPFVPISLQFNQNSMAVNALIDSGAAVNVLPYDAGIQLGAEWNQLTIPVQLAGNLAKTEARAIVLTAKIGPFPSARLAFAWTRDNNVPVILGQTNFFMQFDVCFFRSEDRFEIRTK